MKTSRSDVTPVSCSAGAVAKGKEPQPLPTATDENAPFSCAIRDQIQAIRDENLVPTAIVISFELWNSVVEEMVSLWGPLVLYTLRPRESGGMKLFRLPVYTVAHLEQGWSVAYDFPEPPRKAEPKPEPKPKPENYPF